MTPTTIIKNLAVLATLTAAMTVQGTASATRVTTLSDGFEPPNGQWTFDGEGHAQGGLFNNKNLAHSGDWGAYLWTHDDSWYSVARTINITGWTSAKRGVCATRFYVRSSGQDAYVNMNVEVIDPVKWTYISLASRAIDSRRGWEFFTTNDWVPPRSQVLVRLSVGGALDFEPNKIEEFAFVDDMTTQCVF
jgi:hypothetical protein